MECKCGVLYVGDTYSYRDPGFGGSIVNLKYSATVSHQA